MNILDYITIILFSIGVLITGVSFSKTGKDMKSFFLRWRQRTVGNEWTFIVHGIFLGRNFRRVGVDSLFVWNGINHYPAYNGCCRVCCRHMDCSPMASYSQSHGCRIHNGPSWCQDAEDIYLYFFWPCRFLLRGRFFIP